MQGALRFLTGSALGLGLGLLVALLFMPSDGGRPQRRRQKARKKEKAAGG